MRTLSLSIKADANMSELQVSPQTPVFYVHFRSYPTLQIEILEIYGNLIYFSFPDKKLIPTVPRQENGYDCGMYMLRFIHGILKLQNETFDTSDLNDRFRKKISMALSEKCNLASISQLRRHCYEFIQCIHNVEKLRSRNKTDILVDPTTLFRSIESMDPEEVESLTTVSLTLSTESEVYYQKTGSKLLYRGRIQSTYAQGVKKKVVLYDGTELNAENSSLCVSKVLVPSTKQLTPNPCPVWAPFSRFTVMPVVMMMPGSPTLIVKEKKEVKKRSKKEVRRAWNYRIKTSYGVTTTANAHRSSSLRLRNENWDKEPTLPRFIQEKQGQKDQYNKYIRTINNIYRKYLEYGKADDFNNSGLLTTLTEGSYREILKKLQDKSHNFHRRGNTSLNFKENKPVKYRNEHGDKQPARTNRQNLLQEGGLKFDHEMERIKACYCPVCRETKLVQAAENSKNLTYNKKSKRCDSCDKRDNNDYYISNNFQPIWYERDADGSIRMDNKGRPITRYDIPPELHCLTMPEKLLIRRYAPFIPAFHMYNGNYALKGHCVSFPQDVHNVCDQLPRKKDSIITVIRELRSASVAGSLHKQYKVNKWRVLNALQWLKIHHSGYHDIEIVPENFWFQEDEIDMAKDATVIELQKEAKERDEKVSEAHASSMEEDEDNVIEVCTMHANETEILPKGEQAEKVKEIMEAALAANQSSKVVEFPPIDTEPVW
jgi:hypothetical protein